jgi:linoleoyl-CoA desaturase
MSIKIKSPDGAPFYAALKLKVNNYFLTKKRTGNSKLFVKAAVIILLATFLYLLPYFVTMSMFMYLLICALRGRIMGLSGFNIGHDAIHGSFCERAWVNKLLGYSFDFSGVSSYFWDWKHNRTHHILTNSDDDDDLATNNFLRLAPFQKWYPAHRWQWLYAQILYGFEHLHWVFYGDLKKYRTNSIGKRKIPVEMSIKDRRIFKAGKVLYVVKSLILPIILIGFWKGILGFLVMEFFCGSYISRVFQLAHVQRKSKFLKLGLLTKSGLYTK